MHTGVFSGKSPRFGGYRIFTITADERKALQDFWCLDKEELKKFAPDLEQLENYEPYLPNNQPDKLYLFYNDATGDHATQFKKNLYSKKARNTFITCLVTNPEPVNSRADSEKNGGAVTFPGQPSHSSKPGILDIRNRITRTLASIFGAMILLGTLSWPLLNRSSSETSQNDVSTHAGFHNTSPMDRLNTLLAFNAKGDSLRTAFRNHFLAKAGHDRQTVRDDIEMLKHALLSHPDIKSRYNQDLGFKDRVDAFLDYLETGEW